MADKTEFIAPALRKGPSVLQQLDDAPLSLFHLRAIIIAGAGFFTDAYDLFSISVCTKLIGRIYYTNWSSSKPGVLPINVNAAVTGVALCGTLAGQLFWGYLGDRFGRKRVYGLTLAIMVMCAMAQSMSFGTTAEAVLGTLCFWRFFLGFGIGGDYPLSATIASEYANSKHRGKFIAAVFAMQGIGIITAAIVALIVSSICLRAKGPFPAYALPHPHKGGNHLSLPVDADYLWRIILGFGALPALGTMYYRMMLPETARYTLQVRKDTAKVARNMSQVLRTDVEAANQNEQAARARTYTLSQFLGKYWIPLLGCAMTWFLLDISFYSQNLFQSNIFTAVGWIPSAKTMSAVDELYKIARAQAIIAMCGTIPGYWMTVATVDILGRWKIQMMGFAFMTLFMGILAGQYNYFNTHVHVGGFLTLYALTFFFSNWGPNSTTFVIPAELFPTAWRTSAHGFCAASGKAGAIIGSFGFLYASQDPNPTVSFPYPHGIGLKNSLAILAGVSALGFLFTLLVPETNGQTLEELNDENLEPGHPDMLRSKSSSQIFKESWSTRKQSKAVLPIPLDVNPPNNNSSPVENVSN